MRGHECEWVGGRLPAPFYVTEGAPFRPEIVLWLEVPADSIVGWAVSSPEESADVVATFLAAQRQPLAGPPRRPQRVRVSDAALAARLRAAAPDANVVVAPTPELDALIENMARTMPAGGEPESYLEGGRVSAPTIAAMFRAAEVLWRLAPWKVAYDGQVIRVDVPALGVDGACLSIIGNLGESLGLLLFPSLAGFDAFARAATNPRKHGRPDFGTTVLSLELLRGVDLPPALRREVARYGWPVAGPDAYPRVEHRDCDGMLRPLEERDLRIMIAIATSFCGFFATHRDLFEQDEIVPVCESYYDENDLEVRFTIPYEAYEDFEVEAPRAQPLRVEPKVGRNAPCPCGSGKKYKKCCVGKNEEASRPAHVHETDERLVFEMMRFAEERFGAAWRRAARDFLDPDEAKQLHRPWSVYCFSVEGRPVVDWYLEALGSRLSAAERGWLEAQRRAWLGIWEVVAVEPGKSVSVRDLLSGEERCVNEVKGSKVLKMRDTILGRVIDGDGACVFAGVHPRALPPMEADVVVRVARRKLKAKGAIAVEKLREEAFGRHVIKRWERVVAEMDLQASLPPRLHNTDGDPLLMTTDHFVFEPSKRAELEAGLAAMDHVEPPHEDDPDRCFTFLRPGNAMHKTWETTVVGRAVIDDGKLRVETNSIVRADTLRQRIESAVGAFVRHRAREHVDPTGPSLTVPRSAPHAPSIPPAEEARMLREYKERHYMEWLDEAIPALRGKTPRQAARTKEGRAKVDLLLRDIEHHEASLAEGARFDFSRLRAELGL